MFVQLLKAEDHVSFQRGFSGFKNYIGKISWYMTFIGVWFYIWISLWPQYCITAIQTSLYRSSEVLKQQMTEQFDADLLMDQVRKVVYLGKDSAS